MPTIPFTMRAVVISDYAAGFDHVGVEDREVPQPNAGEVLVKIAASPINPSDLSFMHGRYGVRRSLPAVPGFEASGRVVAVGEGLAEAEWIGRRVACFASGDGTWAEYMVTTAGSCLPLLDSISDEQGAMMLANPLSAYALLHKAQSAQVKAVVQTAAASALGKMIVRLGERMQIEVINVIRRDAHIPSLQAVGARYILNSSEPTFEKHLREVCRQLDARLGFDAVGGALTGQVLRAMPNGAHLIVYGGLADAPVEIGVDQFIFRGKSVDGFWLPVWMRQQTAEIMSDAWTQIQAWIGSDFQTEIRACYPLDQALAGIQDYAEQMTGGKVLLVP